MTCGENWNDKVKIVYVLTSTEQDFYYEQLLISVISLKKYNQNLSVYIVTDDKSYETLVGFRSKIKDLADEIIVVDFEEKISNKVKSRRLKTSLRRRIEGDFLYIDLDTVIADIFDFSDFQEIKIGMILDRHSHISNHHMYMYMSSQRMNYSIGYNDCHYNSGVMFVRDCHEAYMFFELWEKLYLETNKKGFEIDQLSLNEANTRMKGVISELDGTWNVQVNCGMKYIADAKVIHYLSFQPNNIYVNTLPFELCDKQLLQEMKQEEKVTDKINCIIDNPKTSFKAVYIVPDDCIAYKLLFTNHMRLLKYIYVKHKHFYNFWEKIYAKLFFMIFKRD